MGHWPVVKAGRSGLLGREGLAASRASLQRVEHKRIQDGAFTTKAYINTDGGTTWTALATNVA